MKSLHRPDLFGWSRFDESRNVDFNGTLWVRAAGNVVFDPMPLSDHDARHIDDLGGVAHIVITNSDHIRDSALFKKRYAAEVIGPAAERETFSYPCDRYVGDGEEIVADLHGIEMHGSKTPGELALSLGGHTLITGDLVRAHRGGSLMLLPAAKLTDLAAAQASARRLAAIDGIVAVLVGDGWHVFRDGHRALTELAASF